MRLLRVGRGRPTTYGDMYEPSASSIPPRSPVTALQNAASVAGLLLTTEAMIADKASDDDED